MFRCTIGSTGAEGVAPALLTSSLDNGMLIAPMLDLASSIQPVPLRFSHLDQLAHQIAPMHRASDLPTTIGCTDAWASVKQVLLISVELVQFSVSLSSFFVFFLYGLFTSSLGSRNVRLTKPLVSLIVLSYDHQNHSKWHKWCHVRYTILLSLYPFLVKYDCHMSCSHHFLWMVAFLLLVSCFCHRNL